MKVLVVVEKTGTGFSAYSPDIAGCVAAASTRDEVEQTMHEAIEECEKLFRGTTLRMSTEHIGLARASEGLQLVRVGDPDRSDRDRLPPEPPRTLVYH